jgi:hypothetical protein
MFRRIPTAALLVVLISLMQGRMYLFGGRDTVRNFADVQELDFETLTWKKVRWLRGISSCLDTISLRYPTPMMG